MSYLADQQEYRGVHALKVPYIKISVLILSLFLLSGCLYPNSERAENQVPHEIQLDTVQAAIDQYQEENRGLVPIRTKPNDTPIFEKYLIEFPTLKEANAIQETPGNAFENGGYYQYILITPDEDPTVKVIDLRITEALRSVNIRIDTFKRQNTYPPFGEKVDDGIYLPDYEQLNLEEQPTVVSPYSNENLPIVMDVHGNTFVDYRTDLKRAMEEFDHNYQEGD